MKFRFTTWTYNKLSSAKIGATVKIDGLLGKRVKTDKTGLIKVLRQKDIDKWEYEYYPKNFYCWYTKEAAH